MNYAPAPLWPSILWVAGGVAAYAFAFIYFCRRARRSSERIGRVDHAEGESEGGTGGEREQRVGTEIADRETGEEKDRGDRAQEDGAHEEGVAYRLHPSVLPGGRGPREEDWSASVLDHDSAHLTSAISTFLTTEAPA